MLETLSIKNIAVIDSVEIPFKEGLNILSGETGAGKSIVIEAIGLILGSRANTELIRTGCDEASVEGLFDLHEMPWMKKRLEAHGFESNVKELLVRRTIKKDGKHRIYINGQLATAGILSELCQGLVDLCGQHEHQSLLKTSTQTDLLDRYGGLTESAQAFNLALQNTKEITAKLEKMRSHSQEQTQRVEFLKFQIEELKSAELISGEDELLVKEKQLLQTSEMRVTSADAVTRSLDDEEGVCQGLRIAIQKMKALVQTDPSAQTILDSLMRALSEAEEASLIANRYLNSVNQDPARLALIQDRLALLANFRKKYGSTVDEMISKLAVLETEYNEIENIDQTIDSLEKQLNDSISESKKLGKKLSNARLKVSELLADSVTGELKDLKMSEAKFSVAFNPGEFTDELQFLVQTNRGDEARPLGKIVSGGELSRLMLAIRRVIADRGGIGVYLFDEIDAGIGGQTAFQVGKKLKSVAKYNQVICITHLPQVASFADHHLSVVKKSEGKRTLTDVVILNQKDRKEELARMLGGPTLTKKSLENAAELLEMAR